MSSAGEWIVKGATTVIGTTIGAFVGRPFLGASMGFSVGEGLWNQTSEGSSSSTGLGPVRMTKSHRLPVPVIYGEHLVSGNVIYQDAYGDDSPKLDLQVAVSEGQIKSISSVKVNDYELDTSNYSTRLGTRIQSDTSMNSGSHNPYTAYVAASLNADEMELSGAPIITSIVKGRKIDVWNGSSWVNQYSNNPAYVLLDFLTNNRYGLGIDDTQIDKDSFIAVADWCDEDVNGSPRYTLNTVLDRQASSLDIIQKMLQTFQSFLVYSGGELRLKADTVEDSVAQTFDESNIIEDSFGYQQIAGDEIPNVIHAEYMEPDEGWKMVKATYENDTDIRDRGKRIEESLQLQGVTNFDQAGRIARVFHNQLYYNQFMASWEAGIDSIHCEPGDVIELSHSLTGWSNRKFRIMEIREKENDQIQIVAREYNEQVFTDEGIDYQPPQGPALPNPEEPPPDVESVSAVENKYESKDATTYSTAQLNWDRPNNYPFYKRCNIYKKLGTSSSFPDSPIARVEGTGWETDQLETVTYDFKFVTVNRNGIEADFASAPTATLTIQGNTTKPSDVTFIAGRFQNTVYLDWGSITDDDLDFYEVRTDTNWGNTTDALVYRGKSDQVQLDEFPIGGQAIGTRNYTFYIKARNNSGLWSKNADSKTVNNSAPNPPTVHHQEYFESFQVELTPPGGTVTGFDIEVKNVTDSTSKIYNLGPGEVLNYSGDPDKTYDIRGRSYDVIGKGDWGSWITGISPNSEDILDISGDLEPVEMFVDQSLPILPDSDYPEGIYIADITKDGSGNITGVDLLENQSDSWVSVDPPIDDSTFTIPSIIAATIQAGAISTTELAANAATVDKIKINDLLSLSPNGQIAGGAAGFETGTGFWLGDHGTSGADWRFYIGDKGGTGEYLSYENGNITMTGELTLTNEGELQQTASANMVNNCKFEYGMDGWEKYSGNGSATVKTISDAKVGANVIEMTNEYGLMLSKEVPIDPDKLYYTEVWLRRITNPGTQGDIYLALAEYDHTGTLIQTNWRIANGADLHVSDGWTKFSKEISGSDFHSDTTYVKPLIYPGYPDRTCITQATYFRVSEIQAGADLTIENRAKDMINLPDTVDTAGLYATGNYLGFNDGSDSGGLDNAGWQAVIKADGDFYFGGDTNNYMEWNGSTLVVRGDIETNTLIATGVEVGEGVFASSPNNGIKVTANAKVEIEDVDGATIFSAGGEFQGTRIIDQGVVGSQEACNGNNCLSDGGSTEVWHSKTVNIPDNKAWLVRVTQVRGDGSNPTSDTGYEYLDTTGSPYIDVIQGFRFIETGIFYDATNGTHHGVVKDTEDGHSIYLYIHHRMKINADNLSNSIEASAKVYYQVIEVPENAVG